MIIKRVKENKYNDPIPYTHRNHAKLTDPSVADNEGGAANELSQEKSRLGLGDVSDFLYCFSCFTSCLTLSFVSVFLSSCSCPSVTSSFSSLGLCGRIC
jgi:hypothetical protein